MNVIGNVSGTTSRSSEKKSFFPEKLEIKIYATMQTRARDDNL